MANHLIKKATLELVEGATKEEFDALSERVDNIVASQTADVSGFKIETEIATLQIYGTDTSVSNQFLLPLNSEIVEASYRIGGSAWIFDNISVYSSETTSVLAITVSAEFEATGENLEAYIKLVYSYPETSNIQELTDIRIGYDGTVYGSAGEAVRRQIGALAYANSGFNDNVKAALLNLLSKVAFVDENGQQYYDELEQAMEQALAVTFITAVFVQGQNAIYDNDTLDYLKQFLTVTAYYEDGTSGTVSAYTLSGTLTVGTSTITVTYGGKTTTFDVVVSEAPLLPREYQQVEWVSANIQDYNLTAYIDTGFVPTVNSYMKARLAAEGVSEGRAYLGVRDASSGSDKAFCVMEYSSAGKIGYMRWGASVQCLNKDTDFHVYELSPSVSKVDDVSYTMTAPVSTQTISKSIRMFAWWTGGSWAASNSVRISYLELGDNGIISHKFIACYRKSDSVIGFYDVVTEQFKTNEGTGSFTKGADVE